MPEPLRDLLGAGALGDQKSSAGVTKVVDPEPGREVLLGNPITTNVVSQRLGNYQLHPQWGQLFEQMWVR